MTTGPKYLQRHKRRGQFEPRGSESEGAHAIYMDVFWESSSPGILATSLQSSTSALLWQCSPSYTLKRREKEYWERIQDAAAKMTRRSKDRARKEPCEDLLH